MSTETTTQPATIVGPEVVEALTKVVIRACRRLGAAGEPQQAGRLVADAWVVLRASYPRQAQHLDGVMHQIARLEAEQTPHEHTPKPHTQEATMPTDSHVASAERELDVRSEIPRRRHELIFDTFVGLPTGGAYILVNDHDPKPLRYQFEAENAGEFTWEYLEQGPEVWRVRIGRIAEPAAATG